MSLLTNAEILRPGSGPSISGTLPATALPIFTPMYISATDAASGEHTLAVATGSRCDGLLMKASVAAGTVGSGVDYLHFGTVTASDGNDGVFETPYEGGKSGAIVPAEIVEVEGTDYIHDVLADTAAGTPLDFEDGKFRIATGPNVAPCVLLAQMTPTTAGNVRIQVKFEATYKAA